MDKETFKKKIQKLSTVPFRYLTKEHVKNSVTIELLSTMNKPGRSSTHLNILNLDSKLIFS